MYVNEFFCDTYWCFIGQLLVLMIVVKMTNYWI